jgi:hypothetical protein
MARNSSTANRTMISLNDIVVDGQKVRLPAGVLIGRKGVMKMEIERRSRAKIQLRGELIQIQGGPKERFSAKQLISALAKNFNHNRKASLPMSMHVDPSRPRVTQPRQVVGTDGWTTVSVQDKKKQQATTAATTVSTANGFSGLECWDTDEEEEEEVEVEVGVEVEVEETVAQPAAQPVKKVWRRWADMADEDSGDDEDDDAENNMILGGW